MRRTANFLTALLLVWALIPGGFEIAENAYHLAVHSDLAHGRNAGRGHAPFNPEHGCGGGFHLCSCCHLQPSLSEAAVQIVETKPSSKTLGLATPLPHPQGFSKLPEEPPRA